MYDPPVRGPFRPIHSALLAIPLAVLLLVGWHGRHPREDRAAVLAALEASAGPALPDAAGVGASASDPVRYHRDSLYELVDGAAEAYLQRGYERSVAVTYTLGDAPGGAGPIEVAAEVHRFAAAAGAEAQLLAERPGEATPLEEPRGALTDGSVLLLARGRDLLKLTALSAAPETRAALVKLAGAWSAPAAPHAAAPATAR